MPWWWWLAGGLLVFAVFVVYLVWTPLGVAVGVGVTLTVLLILGVWRYGAARIRVDEAGLHAGRTTLPADAIGEVRAVERPGGAGCSDPRQKCGHTCSCAIRARGRVRVGGRRTGVLVRVESPPRKARGCADRAQAAR